MHCQEINQKGFESAKKNNAKKPKIQKYVKLLGVGYEILDLNTAWTNGRRLKKYTYSGAATKLKLWMRLELITY